MESLPHRRSWIEAARAWLPWAVVIVCLGLTDDRPPSRSYALHDRVARILAATRPYEARLSQSGPWHGCTRRNPSDEACDDALPQSLIAAVARALRDTTSTPQPGDRTWATAIVSIASQPGPDGMDAALDALSGVTLADPTNAAALNDLAVADLARASVRHDPQSLVDALEHIERAAELDSSSDVVRFNRALVFERLSLFQQAQSAWNEYVKHGGEWGAEAASHVQGIRHRYDYAQFDTARATLLVSAAHDPQGAREFVLDSAIGRWARAVARGDRLGARNVIVQMRGVGESLAAKSGDSSVTHLMTECLAVGRDAVPFAEAFVRGAAAFRRGDYIAAEAPLDSATSGLRRTHMTSLADWSAILLAGVDMYHGRYEKTNARVAAVEKAAAERNDLTLRARAAWVLGLSASRQGDSGRAALYTALAESLFVHAGERENAATMLSQAGDVDYVLGRDERWLQAKFSALANLHPRRDALRRSGLLINLGKQLVDMGQTHAGIAILREAVLTSALTDRPSDHAEALIRLAHAEFATGRDSAGSRTMREAVEWMPKVSDSLMQNWMQMEMAFAASTLLSPRAPRDAAREMTKVIDFYARQHIRYDVAVPLMRRAQLRLRVRDTSGARADLEAATAMIDPPGAVRSDPAAARDAAAVRRDVFHDLVVLALARHDTAPAFVESQKGRGVDASWRMANIRGDDAIVSYDVLPDETLIWAVTRRGLRLVRQPVTADALSNLVETFTRELRRPSDPDAGRVASRALYDILLKPFENELHHVSALTIVPDGVLGGLPFAALRDPSGEFLVEHTTIRYAEFAHASSDSALVPGRVAVIHAPT